MDRAFEEFKYIGWVPCISGHLFFEYTAHGLGDPRSSLTINNTELSSKNNRLVRHIIQSSTVNWEDHKIPGFSGKYRVIMHSKSGARDSEAHGSVYIFDENESCIDPISTIIYTTKDAVSSHQDIENEYDNLATELLKIQKKACNYSAPFGASRINSGTSPSKRTRNASLEETFCFRQVER